jgi:hypothetical protein
MPYLLRTFVLSASREASFPEQVYERVHQSKLIDEVIGHMREKITLSDEEAVKIFDRVKPTVPPEWYIPYEDTPMGVPPWPTSGRDTGTT